MNVIIPLLEEEEEEEEEVDGAAAVVDASTGTGIAVVCLEGKGASAFPIASGRGKGRERGSERGTARGNVRGTGRVGASSSSSPVFIVSLMLVA